MEKRMMRSVLFVVIGTLLGMMVFTCTNNYSVGDSGFDPAQYYTKSEVESLIASNQSAIISGLVNMNASETRYVLYGGSAVAEPYECFVCPARGVIKNLYTCAPASAHPINTVVDITVRVNSVDTALTLQYTDSDGTSVKNNTSTSVAVNQKDMISLQFKETGGGDPAWMTASFLFDSDI